MLLDSGDLAADDCARHAAELRSALDGLDAPYIEVHDHVEQELECRVRPAHPALAIIVMTRDLAKSYAISLEIALKRKSTSSSEGGGRPPSSQGALAA